MELVRGIVLVQGVQMDQTPTEKFRNAEFAEQFREAFEAVAQGAEVRTASEDNAETEGLAKEVADKAEAERLAKEPADTKEVADKVGAERLVANYFFLA